MNENDDSRDEADSAERMETLAVVMLWVDLLNIQLR